MSELIDKEKLWKDTKRFVEKRIRENQIEMYTNTRRKRFWLKAATNSYIRVKRENSKYEHEDIPKGDFGDIWSDLHNPKYISKGYMHNDLQGGYNWHSSVSFALISKQPYIEMREIRNGRRFYLNKAKL